MMLGSDRNLVIHAPNMNPWRGLSWQMDSPPLYPCRRAAGLPLVHSYTAEATNFQDKSLHRSL